MKLIITPQLKELGINVCMAVIRDVNISNRNRALEKLEELRENPRKATGAHKLKGKLAGKWSCSLGGDIRLMYEIDDTNKEIVVVAAGSHKIY